MSELPPFEPAERTSKRDIARPKPETVELSDLKAFLRAHPHALEEDRELLTLLTPPDRRAGDNVLDMQSFMIERLKSQAVERAAREVRIKQAILADSLEEQRIQKAVTAVAGARSFEHLMDTIMRQLPQALGVTRVSLNIERPHGGTCDIAIARSAASGPIRIVASGAVARLLKQEDAVSGTLPAGEAPQFAGDAGVIRAYVAARLIFGKNLPPGLLAIGAKSGQRFPRGMSLHRYIFLSRIIEQSIRLWLDLPPG